MMRKTFITAALVVALTGMGAATAMAATQCQHVLRLGDVLSPSHPLNKAATKMAAAVKRQSKGKLCIKLFPAGQLGGERQMIQQLRSGILDLGLLSGSPHDSFAPTASIEEVPFAFKTHQDAYAAMDGELGDIIKAQLAKHNIKAIFAWENGFRNFTNNVRPIKKPHDMSGLKFRSAETKMRLDFFKSLGASAVPMSFTELYTSLKQGVVDGQENPLPIIQSAKFYEVQKYLSISHHIWGSFWFEANESRWQKLTQDERNIIKKNAVKYGKIERKMIRKADAKLRKKLGSEGMQISDIDTQEFRKKLSQSDFYGRWHKHFGDKAWAALEKYAGKLK